MKKLKRGLHIASLLLLLLPPIASAATIYLTSGSAWTVPSDWNSANNTIEVIGGGGGGAAGITNTNYNNGGGGGAYAKNTNVTLWPGVVLGYSIGGGGVGPYPGPSAGGNGGDTYLCGSTANCGSIYGSAVMIAARGGQGGQEYSGGVGGQGGVGMTTYNGGNGGAITYNNQSGAGGGGAAGPNGNGASGGIGSNQSNGGSGGGGAGGGSAGASGTGGAYNGCSWWGCTDGGQGGNNVWGYGGGGASQNGSAGGGGGGGAPNVRGGAGGNGIEWGAVGAGGGGGGSGGAENGGYGGVYGGGGGGARGVGVSGGAAGWGAPGIIIIAYTPVPASCSVTLTPSAVNRGSSSTLSWSATNANTSVYIQNVGYVGGSSGSFSVAPTTTTDYSCYAVGSGGSDGWHSKILTVYQYCALPWGGTINNSSSATAYQASTVTYGNSCVSQTRSCTNGTLSGTYQYQSCTVGTPANCTLNGVTVLHGQSHTFYSQQTNPVGQLCSAVSQTRTCTNGVLSGSTSYQYANCTCAPIYSCSTNDVTYTDASCSTSTVASCAAPSFCSAGQSTCINPEPSFNDDGTHTGHLQAQPQIVPPGLTTHIYWDVSNVESCSVTGTNGDSWSGLSGEKTSSPLVAPTTYTLACQTLEGATPPAFSEQVTVSIVPIFQEL